MDGLVSIITPCYNSAPYIAETIESVLAQTYQNWEMIIVDDCSSDNSAEIIKSYLAMDKRIRFYKTDKNSGMPAIPRNIGIEKACGRYIAFIDSDDMWLSTKLERQLKYFDDEITILVFSFYEKMKSNGERKNRVIKSPARVDFHALLKGNCIGCLTAVYDASKIGKVYFPLFRHEDYACWLMLLENGYIARNTNTVEALYRISGSSESSKKTTSMRWTWNIYRDYLKMSFPRSLFYYGFYSVKAVIKHIL